MGQHAMHAGSITKNEEEEYVRSKLICNRTKHSQVSSLTRSNMQLAHALTGRLQVLPTSPEPTQTCSVSRKQHHSRANSRAHPQTRRAFTDQPAQVDMEDPKVCHPARLLLRDNACKARLSHWSASGASANASYARTDATARGPGADERSAGPDAR